MIAHNYSPANIKSVCEAGSRYVRSVLKKNYISCFLFAPASAYMFTNHAPIKTAAILLPDGSVLCW